jgi:hypothetical protein
MSMVVACISWTISRSVLLSAPRNYLKKKSKFFGRLIVCPYCVSHYVAALIAFVAVSSGLYSFLYYYGFVDWFILTIILVWLSAFQHAILDRVASK